MAGKNSISTASSNSDISNIHNNKSAIKAIAGTVCEKLNDAKLKRYLLIVVNNVVINVVSITCPFLQTGRA